MDQFIIIYIISKEIPPPHLHQKKKEKMVEEGFCQRAKQIEGWAGEPSIIIIVTGMNQGLFLVGGGEWSLPPPQKKQEKKIVFVKLQQYNLIRGPLINQPG